MQGSKKWNELPEVFRSLISLRLPEDEVRRSTATAAAFNAFGMPIQLIILRDNDVIPHWPAYLSLTFGATLLYSIVAGKMLNRPRLVASLFVVNAALVSVALNHVYSYLGVGLESLPFQASKLGALVAGILAPGFWYGMAAIALHTGGSIFQFYSYPDDIPAQIRMEEPWALLAFGMAGSFLLIHRLRVRQLEVKARQAKAEAEATRLLAGEFLELRDLMNTPVQAIEIAAALLKKDDPEQRAIVDRLQTSCKRLREIGARLKKYEHAVDWSSDRGGLS